MKIKISKLLSSFAATLLIVVSLPVVKGFASGCPTNKPTEITGTVLGYAGNYHNWNVNVLVGMDLITSSGAKVKPDGSRMTTGGYSYTDWVNQTLAQPGAASGYDSTFGANLADGNGSLCVASNITSIWFELYPKETHGFTDKTNYGEANDQHMAVTPRATNTYNLRIPTSHDFGGNTGDVNGYITYKGHHVSGTALRVVVFPPRPGSDCGVQGFSAAADVLGNSSTRDADYWRVRNLAGGQCGATAQPYKVIVTCIKTACGSSNRSIMQVVYVADGARPRKDFAF